MKTLPLEWNAEADDHWDLTLTNGRWAAVDSEAEYCAQTVANACRLFLEDAYFFRDEGIPYFEDVLGNKPPRSLVHAYLRKAALAVPLVKSVEITEYAFSPDKRVTGGQIRITTENGSIENVVV